MKHPQDVQAKPQVVVQFPLIFDGPRGDQEGLFDGPHCGQAVNWLAQDVMDDLNGVRGRCMGGVWKVCYVGGLWQDTTKSEISRRQVGGQTYVLGSDPGATKPPPPRAASPQAGGIKRTCILAKIASVYSTASSCRLKKQVSASRLAPS